MSFPILSVIIFLLNVFLLFLLYKNRCQCAVNGKEWLSDVPYLQCLGAIFGYCGAMSNKNKSLVVILGRQTVE